MPGTRLGSIEVSHPIKPQYLIASRLTASQLSSLPADHTFAKEPEQGFGEHRSGIPSGHNKEFSLNKGSPHHISDTAGAKVMPSIACTNAIRNLADDAVPEGMSGGTTTPLANFRPAMDISKDARSETPEGLKKSLYRHQELALAWMEQMEVGTTKGGILADDLGLGKTISILALILSRRSDSCLKVCSPHISVADANFTAD